jgi:hypothetical protein
MHSCRIRDTSALGDQQFGRDQLSFLAECQRLRRTVFLDYPFDGDAGIDNERVHRFSRPSRRRTSEGVWCRRLVNFRRSAANVSKDGSTSPIRLWRRISRCSASVERPCRAARRFNRAIKSSSKLRTCKLPAIRYSVGSLISMIPHGPSGSSTSCHIIRSIKRGDALNIGRPRTGPGSDSRARNGVYECCKPRR